MSRIRSQLWTLALLTSATLLIGCGEDGGSNGDGGKDDGRPRIQRLDPDRGPVGSDVVVHGVNFAPGLANNIVRFNGTVSTTFEVDPELKWVRTRVPSGATTGPITMQVDLGDGLETIEGPVFTVTDDKPMPTLKSLSPSAGTMGFTEQKVTLSGGGFVTASRVLFNGKEIEARRTASTSMEITLTAEDAPTIGGYEIQVINDPPGGGSSEKLTFRMVEGIRFLEATAVGPSRVLLRFDRPVDRASAASRGAFEFSPGLRRIERIHGTDDPNSLIVETERSQGANVDYTVTITGPITSTEGGRLVGEKSRAFRSYRYPPVLVASYGAQGCDGTTLRGPVSVSFRGDKGYITESDGNQVQVFEVEPTGATFEGFLGNDGTSSGFHSGAAVAAGCPGEIPEEGEALAAPRGAVGVDAEGGVYVSNSQGRGIVYLDADGAWADFVPAAGWNTAVMQGLHGGKVIFAADDGRLHLVTASSKAETTYGQIGAGPGAFTFAIGSGGIPAMAMDPSQEFAYITEPGNHRVHRVQAPLSASPAFAGVLGKGSERFDSELTPFPDPGPGMLRTEFTSPSGIVVLPDGMLLVADEGVRQGSTVDRGRLQKFEASGLFREELYLDYRPGGMAIDGSGHLWVTDPDNNRIHRYSL